MAKTQDAVWNEINIETLNSTSREAYEEYKTAQRKAAELRTAFEALMNSQVADQLPQGCKLVFGYRFGKLSAAVVADDAKPAKGSPAKQSLADFIAAQKAAGRRV